MYILKLILMVLGTLPIMVALAIGLFLFDDVMVKPRKYASVDKSVAAWNAENWENGDALQVTARISAPDAVGDAQDAITVLCVDKQFRSGRGAYTRSVIWPKAPSRREIKISAPYGDTATLEFVLFDLCAHVSKKHENWTFPRAIQPRAIYAETVANGHTFRGSLKSNEMDSLLQDMRPEIVRIEAMALSSVMQKENYQRLPRY